MLRAYAAYDEEVNYCQGMNFLAALMLTWLPREAEAFGALVLVMKDRGLRELYKSDMQMLQVSCQVFLRVPDRGTPSASLRRYPWPYDLSEYNMSQCLLLLVQARLWQVGKLMPQKLARHMEVRQAWIPLFWTSC